MLRLAQYCDREHSKNHSARVQACKRSTIPQLRHTGLALWHWTLDYATQSDRWVFITANVSKPILGADFLKHYGLLVDMRSNSLHIHWPITGYDLTSNIISRSLLASEATGVGLWEDTVELLNNYTSPQKKHGIKHDVTHNIKTKGNPVCVRPRQLPPEQLKIACQESNTCMMELEVIRRSSSNWACPLHMVPKHRAV